MCAACAEACRSRPRRADASTRPACLSRAFGDSLERVAGRTRRARRSRAPVCSRRSTAYVVAAISRAVFAGVAHARGGKVPAPLDMRDARRARHVRHVAADRAIPDIERRGAVSARLAASAGAAARPHVGHGDRTHLRRGHASGQGLDAYCRIGAALRRSSVGRTCARPPPAAVPARRDRHIRNWHVRNPGRCAADCPDRGRARRSGSTLSTCEGDAVAHSHSNAHFMIQCVRRGGGDSLRFFAPPPAPARA